ncbi:hypothetical protein ACOB87_00300 [Streptomyces sp. YS-B37]
MAVVRVLLSPRNAKGEVEVGSLVPETHQDLVAVAEAVGRGERPRR